MVAEKDQSCAVYLSLLRTHIVRTAENIEAVAESLHANSSTQRRSHELKISFTSLSRIPPIRNWTMMLILRKNKVIFSNKVYVNKQNCHIWNSESAQVNLQNLIHPLCIIFLWKWGWSNHYDQYRHLSHHNN